MVNFTNLTTSWIITIKGYNRTGTKMNRTQVALLALSLAGVLLTSTGAAILTVQYPSPRYPSHWSDFGHLNYVFCTGGILDDEQMNPAYDFPIGGNVSDPGNRTTPSIKLSSDTFTVIIQDYFGLNTIDEEGWVAPLDDETDYHEIPYELYWDVSTDMHVTNDTGTVTIELARYREIDMSHYWPYYFSIIRHLVAFSAFMGAKIPLIIDYRNYTGYRRIINSTLQHLEITFDEQLDIGFKTSWFLNFTQGGRTTVVESHDQSRGNWTFSRADQVVGETVEENRLMTINGSFKSYYGKIPVQVLVKNFPLLEWTALASGMVMLGAVVIAGLTVLSRRIYLYSSTRRS
ncbi:MAG: hypothetical protein ACFFD4_32210 [Candidatus Odinarchaeota archaeon]